MSARPRLGVSACLLGQRVRFNGEDKRQDWIVDTLARGAELVGFCPEMEMGLGAPRPPLRLVRQLSGELRLQTSRARGTCATDLPPPRDLTELARTTTRDLVLRLGGAAWDGFILKKDSPSCGLERVKVYPASGIPERSGRGIFAEALTAAFPCVPTIEEGRLCDPDQRERFLVRVFAHRELRALRECAPGMKEIQAFHRRHKLLLMEHDPHRYRELGRQVGNASGLSAPDLLEKYSGEFLRALATRPTRGRRVNVLAHALGYLRDEGEPVDRQRLADSIEDYRRERLPFVSVLSLLHHFLARHRVAYLLEQSFFAPFPRELGHLARL